jgi:transposase
MAWTAEHRRAADRRGLRYPSDLTDAEWALVVPLIRPGKRGGRPRTVDVREVLNAVFYVLSTGCQWQALPKDLPPKSTVWDYFSLWEWDGTIEHLHHVLYVAVREQAEREASPTTAIIDSQTTKASPIANRRGNGTPDRRRIGTPVWCADARCGRPARSRRRRGGRPQRVGVCRAGSGAVLEPPAAVAGLDDVAVIRQAIEQRGRHLGVAEHARPARSSAARRPRQASRPATASTPACSAALRRSRPRSPGRAAPRTAA